MKLVINRADVEFDGRYAKTPLPTPPHSKAVSAGSKACASEEVVKRDPGLTRAHRSSRVHRWLFRRTVMSFTLDPHVAEALHPLHRRDGRQHAPAAGDATARPSATSSQPSSAFFGGRRSVK